MDNDRRPFGPLLEGFNSHHRHMTMAEIAVFNHLIPQAIRTEARSSRAGFPIGFVPGASANSVAREMGKCRTTVRRALKGLEWNPKTKRHYITRYPEGILIHNFPGQRSPRSSSTSSTSWDQGGPNPARAGSGRVRIQPGGGPNPARRGSESSPH